uniref:NADH dehydrogenase [ubiquinone] 1 alpha subcomplex subunit n=1 Tax=Angiostrongylus cantonensis TaxID=6313 RepID=A0A0K0DRQ5_ANGCA
MSRPGAWAVVLSNLWKYLRKDWSTKASYVLFKVILPQFVLWFDTQSSGYDPPTGASNPQTPTVEWQSWLKGTRRFPPSEEEIALNRMRQQAQLAQNLTTEQRAPHVAATGTSQKQDKPAAFPHFEDLESAPGAKKKGI